MSEKKDDWAFDLFRYKPTKRQREFMENPSRLMFIPPRYPFGKRALQEELIRLDALDAEQAELAIKDLRESGISLMTNGRRVEPRIPRQHAKIEWDEMPSEPGI